MLYQFYTVILKSSHHSLSSKSSGSHYLKHLFMYFFICASKTPLYFLGLAWPLNSHPYFLKNIFLPFDLALVSNCCKYFG